MDASPSIKTANYWIRKLDLAPHPEGGHYRQTYRADLLLERAALPPEFGGDRAVATAIYFLLEGGSFSAFHRLRSDELWHFYMGASLLVHVIEPAGAYSAIHLGADPEAGETFQAVVRAGCWFASEVTSESKAETTGYTGGHRGKQTLDQGLPNERFALVGCTVSPGFEFDDFELSKRDDLRRLHPQHRELIERLTRN